MYGPKWKIWLFYLAASSRFFFELGGCRNRGEESLSTSGENRSSSSLLLRTPVAALIDCFELLSTAVTAVLNQDVDEEKDLDEELGAVFTPAS